jgi:hypothetical protein
VAANPVLLFAYANDRQDDQRYMRNLPEERRAIEAALRGIEDAGTVDVVHCPNATIDEVLDKCQRCGDRLAVFHFAGHADGKTLLFEQRDGSPAVSHARSIAEFLATFGGLRLVVLNGCSTQDQVESLLALGVPAVVATSTLVRDEVATSFAGHLYTALAAGETVETAFRRASSAVVVRFTTGTDGALGALCRDVVAKNTTISLPSLWGLHGAGTRQFRLIPAADPIGAAQPGAGARDAGVAGVRVDAGSSTPSRRYLPRLAVAVAAALVAVVGGYFVLRRPASAPAPAPASAPGSKPEDLAETVKLVALLAQVPDRGVRIELLKKITGKKELDRDLVAQIESFEITGTRTAEYQIRLEANEARALDTAGATRVLESGPSVAGLPCRGQLDFEVREGLLACKNGVPIAAVTTPNTGGALAEVKLIVFHSTDTEGLASTMRVMQDPQRSLSAHLLIDRDGTVVQMVRFDRIAWHAGKSHWGKYDFLNSRSIGVQMVNLGRLSASGTGSGRPVPADQIGTAADGSRWQSFTRPQIAVATAIARALARTYPIEDIVGHCHISPEMRQDPGPIFPFAEVVPAVLGRPSTLPPCGVPAP